MLEKKLVSPADANVLLAPSLARLQCVMPDLAPFLYHELNLVIIIIPKFSRREPSNLQLRLASNVFLSYVWHTTNFSIITTLQQNAPVF